MSTCIYKYPLQEFSIGGQFVSMPQGARLLTAQLQDDVLVIWAVVVQENIQVHRKIVLVGTGAEPVQDSTGMWYEPFAWFDRKAACWKTWKRCSETGWALFSQTWPRSGMTRNGIAFQRVPLVPRRNVIGSGLLPTLAKSESRDWSQAQILARLDRGGRVARRICSRSQMLRSSAEIVGLSPSFAEMMTGLPPGHTE